METQNATPCERDINDGLARAYRDACLVQSACNLVAVVNGWARAMTALWAYASAHGHGTDWVNQHSVNVLFAQQVYHLTGNGSGYTHAYFECHNKRKGE